MIQVNQREADHPTKEILNDGAVRWIETKNETVL
jgi:hypothetical protein